MILVTGGTGTLGTQVVRLLSDQGVGVRVLTRDAARAAHLPDGTHVVEGDVRDAQARADAVRGVTTVISAVHGFAGPGKPSPQSIDRDANAALIAAAGAAGVQHFILLSVVGAAGDHPMSLFRAKYAAERALQASSMAATIIRCTAFLETWTGIIGGGIAVKGQALVFGPGRNPINFVSAHDVAAVVDLAVRDPGLRGQTVDVGGPQNLSFTAIAERLIAASGKPGRIKHIPLPMLRAMSVLARPVAPVFARQAAAAVVMNTTDLTVDPTTVRARFPTVPATTLDDVLERHTRATISRATPAPDES
jgi:NADH dehydrogenase